MPRRTKSAAGVVSAGIAGRGPLWCSPPWRSTMRGSSTLDIPRWGGVGQVFLGNHEDRGMSGSEHLTGSFRGRHRSFYRDPVILSVLAFVLTALSDRTACAAETAATETTEVLYEQWTAQYDKDNNYHEPNEKDPRYLRLLSRKDSDPAVPSRVILGELSNQHAFSDCVRPSQDRARFRCPCETTP